MDNQDKQSWCYAGEGAEYSFLSKMLTGRLSVMANPEKSSNKFTHDFYLVMPCDLKTIRTRFRTADRYGIDPFSAITLNKKDVDRYSELYPHIVIIFDVDYGDYKRLCYAPLRQIKKAISSGHAKLHTYKERINDTQGNAKESYVIDSRWFTEV